MCFVEAETNIILRKGRGNKTLANCLIFIPKILKTEQVVFFFQRNCGFFSLLSLRTSLNIPFLSYILHKGIYQRIKSNEPNLLLGKSCTTTGKYVEIKYTCG